MAGVLAAVGVALTLFGAFVLLRHSDRPGGTVKWLGLEVTSTGAGLPLVALGIACVAAAAFGLPGSARGGATGAAAPGPAAPAADGRRAAAPGAADCLGALFAAIPADRVGRVEAGTRDLDLLAPPQPLDRPFGIVLTDGGEPVGAVRMRLYPGGLFKVEAAVGADCRPAAELRNVSRGGDAREVQSWDTLRLRLGEHEYDLRIGAETTIRLNFLRVS